MPRNFSIRELHDKANLSLPRTALAPAIRRRSGRLSDEFVIPPFTILDARQGDWQKRKKIYLGFGIKSELGRGQQITFAAGGGEHITEDGLNYYRNRQPSAAPGGQPRPAMRVDTVRGDGQGRPLARTFNQARNQTDLYERENAAAGRARLDSGRRPDAKTFNSGNPGDLTRQMKGRGNGRSNYGTGYTANFGADRNDRLGQLPREGFGPKPHGNTHGRDTSPALSGGRYAGGDAYRYTNVGESELNRRKRALTYNTTEWVKELRGEDFAGLGAETSGTSVFDPVLCELMIRWFCPPHGVVLDPFAGGSVRGIVSAYWERGYVGIDLRPEQVAANEQQRKEIMPGAKRLHWITGDSRDMDDHLGRAKFDLLFTCPPYFNLELYSYDPADLSNADNYEEFMDSYRLIMHKALDHLRRDRFAAVVVGNLRAKDGSYFDLVGDTVDLFTEYGAHYYNEAILVTAAGSLPIRVRNQFNASRKLGKTHQQVLIFCKGSPQRAAEAIND